MIISLDTKFKLGASLLHGVVCGYAVLRDRKFMDGRSRTNLCRACGTHVETLEHVLLHCTSLSEPRSKLRSRCGEVGVPCEVRVCLCHPEIRVWAEEFFVILDR